MEQLDQQFTEELQQWLAQPAAERDLRAGAELFLRLRPSARHLYHSFIVRPQSYAPRLEYELKKHLRIRLEGYTMRQVAVMNKTLVPEVKNELAAQFKGRRADHDRLPQNIQQLYDKNGVIFEKMKSLYNTLLGMEDAPVCDRFEYLQPLRELDDAYRHNWDEYDSFKLEAESPDTPATPAPDETETADPLDGKASTQNGKASTQNDKASTQNEKASTSGEDADAPAEETPLPTAKEVSAARKFISSNLHRLEHDEMDEKRRNELVTAIYERVCTISNSGGSFKPEMADRLRVYGIDV